MRLLQSRAAHAVEIVLAVLGELHRQLAKLAADSFATDLNRQLAAESDPHPVGVAVELALPWPFAPRVIAGAWFVKVTAFKDRMLANNQQIRLLVPYVMD